MEGKRLIHLIKLTNLLSFGPEGMEVEIQPLNVLVGANGSGKSNFIEAFRLLRGAATDLAVPIREGGGTTSWIWKGSNSSVASVETETGFRDEVGYGDRLLLIGHLLEFEALSDRTHVLRELIAMGEEGEFTNPDQYLYRKDDFQPVIMAVEPAKVTETGSIGIGYVHPVTIEPRNLKPDQSILSQRNDPEFYPEISYLARQFSRVTLYTDAPIGRLTLARRPQDASLDSFFLFEDASNLALVLNDLQNQPPVMRNILEKLKLFYERVENIITRVQGGTVQIYFQEEGLTQTVPATRLSDGTLRYLCLLVILLHPTPPPLICIEEPELGMHPDIIPTIADLLIEASQRTQLIVTTHSDMLVSAIGAKHPEAILVCDRTSKGTTLTRLEPEKLTDWLKDYTLGEVWLKGAIGGTRW